MSEQIDNLRLDVLPGVRKKASSAINALLDSFKTELNFCVPAIVTEVIDDNTVKVLPLPKYKFNTDSGAVDIDRDEVEVPCMNFMHGGFLVHAPMFKGDTGWLIAGDRDTEEMRKENMAIPKKDEHDNKGSGKVVSHAHNEFDFGFFIPDSWAKMPKPYDELNDKFIIGNIQDESYDQCYLTIDDNGECKIMAQGVEFIFNYSGLTINGIDRSVFIDPGNLDKTDAWFRDVSVVVDARHGDDGKVHLTTKKMKVLADEAENGEEIEFEAGKGEKGDKGDKGDPGEDGADGTSVTGVESGDPIFNPDDTITPLTFLFDHGKASETVSVVAKNGQQGQDGDSIVRADSVTPPGEAMTATDVTFTWASGKTQTIKVWAKDGQGGGPASDVSFTDQTFISSVSWGGKDDPRILMDGYKMSVTNGVITSFRVLTEAEKNALAIDTIAHSEVVGDE